MRRVATGIVQRLAEAGHTALFAGGCVRDMVRRVEPHDYDIATTATPEEVQRLFPKTIPAGAQFGVVLVLENDHQFEVATFRTDEAYVDGRRPTSVRYGTPEQDAQRRDFTINGLFYDPLTHPSNTLSPPSRGEGLDEGRIIDYVGGQADIARKLVRTIGEPRQRFAEDKLRMLRCVRFAANLGYEIDPDTFAAVREMAAQIGVVSEERIRDELVKTLTRPNAGRGLVLLEESGLLQQILPEVAAMNGVEQPPEFHPEGDVFTHTKLMLDLMSEAAWVDASTNSAQALRPPEARLALRQPGIVLAFAVLLHDVGKPPTFERAPDRVRFHEHDKVGGELSEKIMRRLRFPNEVIEKVCVCVGEHMRIRHVQDMRPAKLKRILARETFADELELHRLDCLTSHGDIANYEFLRAKAAELPPEVLKPAPLATGHDLLALGFAQGPLLGQVLRELEELQLEERLQSREEALAYARRRLGSNPSS